MTIEGTALAPGAWVLGQTGTGAGTPPPEIPGMPVTSSPASGSAPLGPGGGAPPTGAGGGSMLLILFLVLGLMIVMQVVAGRRERKKRDELLGSLAVHDRVQTMGGMIGTVAELRDDEVVLRVDEGNNTKIRFTRGAIQTVLKKAGAPA